MSLFRIFLMIASFVLIAPKTGRSQISQGGVPLKPLTLKSSHSVLIEMPPIENFISEKDIQLASKPDNLLKPFQFAYPFEVNLTTENSGAWFRGENGYKIWKISIRSAGAKSLNLIFDEFKLPEGARLFLYSNTEDYILGAFTNFNNKESGKFAVMPVPGDEITVQYEVPGEYENVNDFRIINVNHDYVGILKSGDRRPMGKTSASCNVDVNCDDWKSWSDEKNSVCRLIVRGTTICSGVLLNNTAENRKPYILSASHCYGRKDYAEVTVYAFNYESPFCAPLDGDPVNSISGATMKAQFDSLDISLVEMSLIPPPEFRPYYAGWDRSANVPGSTVSIHHPQGDIKKISQDKNSPVVCSFGEPGVAERQYTKNGFLRINRWEVGVTEQGSSGGPLFSTNRNVIGTLTGGEADCSSPVYDYYERFNMSWDYKTDTTKQLKHWLDPLNSGVQVLDGKQFYEGEDLCGAFTNLNDDDDYAMVPVISNNKFAGYWGGSNNLGITEFVEKYSIEGNENLAGVSFGVGKFKSVLSNTNSEIKIKVYNGSTLPEQVIYSQTVKTSNLVGDAMNYIGFNENVTPDEVFFIGFELSNIQPLDSFVVYQSLRPSTRENTFYFLQNNKWYNFKDANASGKSMANIFELVACNIDNFTSDTPKVDNPLEVFVFPNPSNSKYIVKTGQDLTKDQISVFNILGQKVEARISTYNQNKFDVDLTGNTPGIYFIRIDAGKDVISRKVSFVPW